MSWVTIIWSMIASVSFTLATIYLLIWFRERRSWAYLCFLVMAVGVIGLATGELAAMYAKSPTAYGTAVRWSHFAYGFVVAGSLGFVHFYFGTGKRWLLGAALGLRLLAVVVNFSTGLNLHISAIQSLQQVNFLGEPVSMLGVWTPNPWVRLGQFAALVQFVYVVDASLRLWRAGPRESRRRAVIVGGTLAFFILFASAQAGLVVGGVLRMPIVVSFPFLAVLLAMSYELSRDALRAAQLGRELRESEARMSMAAEAAGFGVWMWNIACNQVWASERWLRLFGFASDEAVTFEKIIQRVHPDDREMVEREVRRALESGGDYARDYRLVLPDGTQHWVAARGRVYPDANGKPTRMLGASLDITPRKEAEAALKQSEERFRQVAETVGEFIWEVDAAGLYTFASPAVERTLGYTPEELVGEKHFYDLFEPSVREERKAAAFQVFAARQAFRNFPNPNLSKSGKIVHLETSGAPMLDAAGNLAGYRGADTDVTERKRAEERSRNARELMAAVFNSVPGLLYLYTADGRLVRWNKRHEEMTGYTTEELLNFRIEDWVEEEDRIKLAKEFSTVFSEGFTQVELNLVRKDGRKMPVFATGSKVIIDGKPHLVGIAIDISDRKRAEQELQQQRNELAHLSRVTMLGELSGSLAHELNQPLTAILSNAQAAQRFLAHDNADLNEVRDILKDIVGEDKRAGEVIRRLRGLLKKDEVHHQPFDINEVVQEVLKLVRSDLVNQGVAVHTELAPALPEVNADRVQLQQVLLNLVMNACDAMAGGPAGDHKLIIRTELAAGESIRVSVADRGVGVAPNNLEKAFEPFFTTKVQGMGLGLSVCRTIITAHGGKLWAVNNPERGATFHFTLPVGAVSSDQYPVTSNQ